MKVGPRNDTNKKMTSAGAMKMVKQVIKHSIIAATFVFGGQAFAGGIGDTVVAAPTMVPAAQPSNWTGFYAGGQIGFADAEVSSAAISLDGNGVALGVHAGYTVDLGDFVLGAEVDFDTLNIDIGQPAVLGGGTIADWMARLKFRAGYDFGQTMVYGTAGFAQLRLDESTDPNPANESSTEHGHVFGVGIAHQISSTMIVSGEILHHDFSDIAGIAGLDADVTTASLRLSLRF